MSRTICVVTGTRAEYGLLYWLMKEIEADPGVQLQVCVTGMHLSPEFGLTYRAIEADGFRLDARVEMLVSSDTPVGVAKSIGLGVSGFADAFARLRPDLVVVLGDRYEVLAAAQAAMVARIPLAHLHGGEATEGLFDEPIRHAVTKMAQLHFVAADAYRRRVIQLGEWPDRVFDFGALALDNVRRLELLDRAALERELGFALGRKNVLATYHPVTFDARGPAAAVHALLEALARFDDVHVIFTKANADPDGRIINAIVDEHAARFPDRVRSIASLGQLRYLSALRLADTVVGNSSSGIIEAPMYGTPTVNLGERQRGRLRARSIIDCAEDADAIAAAIERAFSSEFRNGLAGMPLPYGAGDASRRIKDVLKTVALDGIVMKRFYDVPVSV